MRTEEEKKGKGKRTEKKRKNKLCFRSDPFLHSPIYPYVLKCYMYFLE